MKAALESLSTIGTVEVTRSDADENRGYTWAVTFLTEMGDLPTLILDQESMIGAAVSTTSNELIKGVHPPFNSLDRVQGLSLGSAVVADLSDLSVRVRSLREGIPYYFRVQALNEVGYGPWTTSSPNFELPLPQQPNQLSDISVNVVDGDSLRVSFAAPEHDGGKVVDKYRVEWDKARLVDEIQEVKVDLSIRQEVQVVSTSTDMWTKYSSSS